MTTLFQSNPTAEVADTPTVSGAKPKVLSRPKPITVNGVTITRTAIGRETQNHPAGKPIEAWFAAARALVVRELLLQEARRLDIEPAPVSDGDGRRETDEEAVIRQLVEREVVTPVPDEAACSRIYVVQRAKFRSSDLHAVRHILIAAAPGDTNARAEARATAVAAIATLEAEPSRFAELALQLSACPSRAQGGALGQISRGQTVDEFEAALATAPIGSVAPQPVESRYGLHIILVDQRIEGRQLPFEMVHRQIAAWLAATAQQTALRQYITLLAGRADITGITLDGSASPLVQ